MYWNPETISTHIAKKEYPCDACVWLDNLSDWFQDLNFTEKRQIAKAIKDNLKIKKGQKYLKVTGKYYGEWSTFRARPEIDQICHKYQIYQY